MVPTCFGLRPSSGSLLLSLAKVILILKLTNVLCSAQHTIHTPFWDMLPHHRKLQRNVSECLYINITLARLNCKLPDDGRRPKHVGAI